MEKHENLLVDKRVIKEIPVDRKEELKALGMDPDSGDSHKKLSDK